MFSVAVLLLLLAAGSGVNCEQLTQPGSLTVRLGQPLTIRCQVSGVEQHIFLQFSFNTNHVLSSCDAAPGCWLWVRSSTMRSDLAPSPPSLNVISTDAESEHITTGPGLTSSAHCIAQIIASSSVQSGSRPRSSQSPQFPLQHSGSQSWDSQVSGVEQDIFLQFSFNKTMFSVAVMLLLLAAGSGVKCEQLTQPESLTVRPGQPLTIRCQVSGVEQHIFLQFSFKTNHVLCNCTAVAPGCWLWCEL
ncbi:unnamed protein product [Gadus morhua 'NCC']